MTDKPFVIRLEHVKQHENGDATYTFDLSETAEKYVMEEGLKLMLFCGVAKVDIQDVYEWIMSKAPEIENDGTEDPMSSPGDKDYEI